ncbi:MAG TPA: hypothetical protein VJ861_05315 [Treponemataceae bacterium]|nr:hypothetical protein [Treponemataceae bacterium]
MKKKWFLYAGIFLLVITFIGCKSTPPVEPDVEPVKVVEAAPVVEKEPDVKPVDAELTALRDKAQLLHETGIKYGINSYKPEAWGEAVASQQAGLAEYGKNYDSSFASFQQAIQQYESLIEKSFNDFANEMEQTLIEARKKAVSLGADSYYPLEFALADSTVDEALRAKDSSDLPLAYETAQLALMRYQILTKGMQALEYKRKIDANNFGQYSPQDYDKAHMLFEEAASLYGTADPASLEAAEETLILCRSIYNAGFKVWAIETKTKSLEIKDLCDSIKAGRAMKGSYDAAQEQYHFAELEGRADRWESAYNAYDDSAIRFAKVFQEVTLKRNAANLAISSAKEKQEESAARALEADKIAPLPEDAEGYSNDTAELEEEMLEETK